MVQEEVSGTCTSHSQVETTRRERSERGHAMARVTKYIPVAITRSVSRTGQCRLRAKDLKEVLKTVCITKKRPKKVQGRKEI